MNLFQQNTSSTEDILSLQVFVTHAELTEKLSDIHSWNALLQNCSGGRCSLLQESRCSVSTHELGPLTSWSHLSAQSMIVVFSVLACMLSGCRETNTAMMLIALPCGFWCNGLLILHMIYVSWLPKPDGRDHLLLDRRNGLRPRLGG